MLSAQQLFFFPYKGKYMQTLLISKAEASSAGLAREIKVAVFDAL